MLKPTYHIFPHIVALAFSKSFLRKLCRICRTSKNSHIFAHMPHISAYAIAFFQHFLSNFVIRHLNILAANDYRYLQLDVEYIKSKMSKLCRIGLLMVMIMMLRHSKLHMPEICGIWPEICGICSIYAAYFAKFRIFSHIFFHKSSAYFKKFLRYKLASLHSIQWRSQKGGPEGGLGAEGSGPSVPQTRHIGCLRDPANVQQTSSKCIQNTRELLDVCWTSAGSCKHPNKHRFGPELH